MYKSNYPVGDFLIRIKNAVLAGRKEVVVQETKLIYEVAKVLNKLGYLSKVTKNKGMLKVVIVYKKRESLITDIKLVSKPGLRIYMKVKELERHKKPTTMIVSTPKGIMSSNEAIKKRFGGEVIAEIL